jgi:hypothetical protein
MNDHDMLTLPDDAKFLTLLPNPPLCLFGLLLPPPDDFLPPSLNLPMVNASTDTSSTAAIKIVKTMALIMFLMSLPKNSQSTTSLFRVVLSFL